MAWDGVDEEVGWLAGGIEGGIGLVPDIGSDMMPSWWGPSASLMHDAAS